MKEKKKAQIPSFLTAECKILSMVAIFVCSPQRLPIDELRLPEWRIVSGYSVLRLRLQVSHWLLGCEMRKQRVFPFSVLQRRQVPSGQRHRLDMRLSARLYWLDLWRGITVRFLPLPKWRPLLPDLLGRGVQVGETRLSQESFCDNTNNLSCVE